MAKFYGGSVKVGKKGDAVFRVRFGETIESQYQPIVANPSTTLQVQSRAKLKLASQLSAVLAPVVAIKRIGSKSPRNLFVKANYPLLSYNGSAAEANLNGIQLTKSVVAMVNFNADRTSGNKIAVELNLSANGTIDRVVYVECVKQADNSLRLIGSSVVETAGVDGKFAGELPFTSEPVVILAYGVRDNNDRSKAIFGNMTAPTAEEVARLVVSRQLLASDTTLTETLGLTMALGENTGDSENFDGARVILGTIGSGSVSGAGRYPIGTQVTVRATAAADWEFIGWYQGPSGAGQRISANANYTFTVNEDTNLVAKFQGAPVTLTVQSSNNTMGTVSGGETVPAGSNVTARATPNAHYVFKNWTENGNVVSTDANYTFVLNTNRTLVANFEAAPTVTVAVSADPAAGGTVSGGGSVEAGTSVTVTATAESGYIFVAWHAGTVAGEVVSSNASYTFQPAANTTLVAEFMQRAGVRLESNLLDGIVLKLYENSSAASPLFTYEIGQTTDIEGGDSKYFTIVRNGAYDIQSVVYRHGTTVISSVEGYDSKEILKNVPATCNNIYVEGSDA